MESFMRIWWTSQSEDGSDFFKNLAVDCPYLMHLFQPKTVELITTNRSPTNETALGATPAEAKMRHLTR